MKVITMPVWGRPQYAFKALESLSHCAGIEHYLLLIHIDGACHQDMKKLACSVEFCERIVVEHGEKLGCNGNTRHALAHGFKESNFVIHVEEDVVLAPDTLRWFEWANQFGSDADIFTVNAWRHDVGWLPESGSPKPADEDQKASKIPFFNCWGWATWIDRWREIDAGWTNGTDLSLSWDVKVSEIRGNRMGIQPHISRAMNIGSGGGVHRGDCLLTHWAGIEGFKTTSNYTL